MSNRAERRANARGRTLVVTDNDLERSASMREATRPASPPSERQLAAGEPARSPIERLRAAIAGESAAREQVALAVDECRSAGQSWAAIATEFGVSVQAVHKRFGSRRVP